MKIIHHRAYFFSVSAIFLLFSLIFLFGSKLNLGIDMTGGTQTEYRFNYENIDEVRAAIASLGDRTVINGTTVYKISGEESISVIAGFNTGIEETKLDILKNDFRAQTLSILKTYDPNTTELEYTNIGKSFGDYIKNTAILTLSLAIIAIAIYVTWSFSGVVSGIGFFSFSSITIITLFHDVLVATGAYIFTSLFFPEFKIDTFFITALLTILGYSINDTIVVFDRIRSNLRLQIKKQMNLEKIIELSINETIRRSIYTSLTLLFVLTTIFLWGPDSISGFILVMIFGTVFGTYSSIFIAAPLLYEFNKNRKLSVLVKKKVNPEDKIVV